jgi:hypothetical protein
MEGKKMSLKKLLLLEWALSLLNTIIEAFHHPNADPNTSFKFGCPAFLFLYKAKSYQSLNMSRFYNFRITPSKQLIHARLSYGKNSKKKHSYRVYFLQIQK